MVRVDLKGYYVSRIVLPGSVCGSSTYYLTYDETKGKFLGNPVRCAFRTPSARPLAHRQSMDCRDRGKWVNVLISKKLEKIIHTYL